MARLKDYIQLETTTGDPVTAQGAVVRPQNQALGLRLPKVGGFVWNRPVAVLVERDGQTERLPIFNVNRWLNIGLGLMIATAVIVAATLSSREKESMGDE